jgi:hypothetical protein
MPPFLLGNSVAALERLGEAHDLDPRGACAVERLREPRGLERRELDIGSDAAADLPVAVAERPVERELLALVRASQELRNLAPPGFLLECREQCGADAPPPMRGEHGHADELRPVGARRETGADVRDRGDGAVRRLDAHSQERGVFDEVLPVAPLLRAALLHPVLFLVALYDERVAVAVLEVSRAVTRRQARAETENVSYNHRHETMTTSGPDRQCSIRRTRRAAVEPQGHLERTVCACWRAGEGSCTAGAGPCSARRSRCWL